jgi:hypothetical protein
VFELKTLFVIEFKRRAFIVAVPRGVSILGKDERVDRPAKVNSATESFLLNSRKGFVITDLRGTEKSPHLSHDILV